MTPPPAAPAWPPPPGRLRAWLHDLLTGARLAVGGNRAGWLRIGTVAAGIGFAVTVLLLAASVGNLRDAQDRRGLARVSFVQSPIPGVDPLHVRATTDTYRNREILLYRVRAGGPRAPLPPGLDRIPGPGEQVVSPALARLLASPDGALLRERYGARTIGTVGPAGLAGGPDELVVHLGSADLRGETVYAFGGREPTDRPLPPLLWVLLVLGVVVLLVPVFVLVSAVSRLSASERQRRLAAIRLVGAGAWQVRRIAAGEVLAGTLLGLVAGAGLFLAARRLVGWDAVSGLGYGAVRPFAADVVPAWPLLLLVVTGVPVLAVSTTLLALRGTVTEPLATERDATPAPPRLWWRLLPAAAGVALLATLTRPLPAFAASSGTVRLVAGLLLLLLAVPALLPWLLHRTVRRPWDATPALQLATGRLRLDSGPSARLVGGLAVTLTGAIAATALLAAAQDRYVPPDPDPGRVAVVQSLAPGSVPAGLRGRLRAVPGVTSVVDFRQLALVAGDASVESVTVASCPTLRTLLLLTSCADGRWYHTGGGYEEVGGRTFLVLHPSAGYSGVTVRMPGRPERLDLPPGTVADGSGFVTTPSALRGVPAGLTTQLVAVGLDGHPDTLERVRTAVVSAGWQVVLTPAAVWFGNAGDTRSFTTIRRGLLAGALLMLTLGAAAVLVLCLQQVRDARVPLAALAAAGVPRAVLARALGWQNAIPLALAVLLADGAGILLVLLLRPVAAAPVLVDWPTVGLLTVVTLLAGAGVTALALPAVRAATRPGGLRTE